MSAETVTTIGYAEAGGAAAIALSCVARSLSDVAATAQRNWRSGLGSSELIDDVAAESFRIDRSGMTIENMQWPLMD